MASRVSFPKSAAPHIEKRDQLSIGLLISAIVGFLYFLINFPRLITTIIETNLSSEGIGGVLSQAVWGIQNLLPQTSASPAIFINLITLIAYASFVFALLLAVYSLRHNDIVGLLFSIAVLFSGILFLHFVAYLAILVLTIAQTILAWIFLLPFAPIIIILSLALLFLGLLINWKRTLRFIVYINILILILFIILNIINWLIILFRPIIAIIESVLYPVMAFIIRFYFFTLKPLLDTIVNFLVPIFRPIISFLANLFSIIGLVIVLGVAAGTLFVTIGHFLIDQFKSAWEIGRNRKSVLLGCFGIGTAVGLVLLVCVGNARLLNNITIGIDNAVISIAGASTFQDEPSVAAHLIELYENTLPKQVKTFVFTNMQANTAPIVDGAILFIVIIMACVGLLRGLPRRKVESDTSVTFYSKELVLLFTGLFVAVSLAVVQSAFESDSN